MPPNTLFDSLATIPKLKKLNLSRNRLEAWHGETSLPQLQELYFAFNHVSNPDALVPAIVLHPNLSFFVVTGNPFAATMTHAAHLELLMADRQGSLVNESLNPPEYLKGARNLKAEQNQLF